MSNTLRSLIVGLFTGVTLSLARAPLGVDLLSIPAVSSSTSLGWRAGGLLLIALALGRSRSKYAAPSVPAITAGAALGFGLHGFFGMGCLPGSGILVALALAALAMERWVAPAQLVAEDEPAAASPVTLLGLASAGAGASLTMELLARPLRLLGLGTTGDDTVFGFAFLCLLAIGAVSFSGLVNGPRRGRSNLAAGLALGSMAGLYGVVVLAEFSSRMGLDGYLRLPTWDLDTSYIGMIQADLLLAGRTLLLPAFVLGAALCGARRRIELTAVVAGGALGLVILARAFPDLEGSEEQLSLLTAERVTLAITLAAVGGLIACAGELWPRTRASGSTPGSAPVIGLVLCVAALIVPRVLPAQHVLPLSPWEQFAPSPRLLVDTAQGLLTVETSPGGGEVLTLDRRRLTPGAKRGPADAQRLRLSWELLSEAERASGRVLLVGQLTPLRALVLSNLGATRVDRTAAWHRAMPAVDQALFGGPVPGAGEILAPEQALERLRDGAYDLVIVPPVAGSTPRVDLGAAGDTAACVWIATDVHTAWRDWGERVLLSSAGLGDLHLGLTNRDSTIGLPSGPPQAFGSELQRLLVRPFERSAAARAAVAQRLANAEEGEGLATGLALHYAAQKRSSPWETDAQQVEVSGPALEQLRGATLALAEAGAVGEVGTYLRELWHGIAALLIEKREIELAYANLGPLAEAFAPWTELERALAAADLEMLDPGSAAERLLVVIAAQPYDLNLRADCADALAEAGRPTDAAEQCRAALKIQPGRRDFERRLAVALLMAGDPEGAILIEDLLLDDPDDHDLEAYLEPGPYEPLPREERGGDRHDH